MKVKALRQVCGAFGSFKPGAVFELSPERAIPMIEAGAAELVEEKKEKKIVFETAVVEPEIETAEAKPKRKAKGKHVSGKK